MVDKGVIVLDWVFLDDNKMINKVSLVMFFVFDLIGIVFDLVFVCIEVLV